MSDLSGGAHLIFFRRGDWAFALDVQSVRRAVLPNRLRPLPATPPYVIGGILEDGRIEVLVDPAALLGKGLLPDSPPSRAILVRGDGAGYALAADTVDVVTEVSLDDIQSPPSFLTGLGREALLGMLVRDGRDVHLLDPARLVAPADLGIS